MKHKRVLTDEQRKAASDRMRKRWAKVRGEAELELPRFVQPPEVQAILAEMSPERKAKLAMIQARMLSTKDGQEALARREEQKAEAAMDANTILPPSRVGSREVSLIVRTDGTCVSQYGPCICGRAKREWHKICVKEQQNG